MLKQTFTIFRTEAMRQQTSAGLVDVNHITAYAGFGTDPSEALDEVMTSIAEQEADIFDDDVTLLEDHEALLSMAIDDLPGEWEVYHGSLQKQPSTNPLVTA